MRREQHGMGKAKHDMAAVTSPSLEAATSGLGPTYRSWWHRRFVGRSGTAALALFHVIAAGAWVTINTGLIPRVPVFDPYPFRLLALIVAIETLVFVVFVLARQSHIEAQAEKRSRAALQLGLMTENQVGEMVQILKRIESNLGVDEPTDRPASRPVTKPGIRNR
jgi:uncharacterized membrane protein